MSHKYYKPARSRLQRSELAVPGSSPQMFEKALNSAADYIFLDLEDAVSPNDKITARANIIKALNEMNWREKGKTISVRINSLDTHYMYSDLVEIVEQAGENVICIHHHTYSFIQNDLYSMTMKFLRKILLIYCVMWKGF
mgnify:CR=1 FL=1